MSGAAAGDAGREDAALEKAAPETDGGGRIVILGVGNLLLTDEGVGPLTIAYLGERWHFPHHVELVDGATAGLELINVFQSADHIVVVDTVLGGAEPGALYRFHPDDVPMDVRYRTSIHQVSFIDAWTMARLLGPAPDIVIIGVEPEDMATPHVGLTATIEARLPDIEELVLAELSRLGVTPERIAETGGRRGAGTPARAHVAAEPAQPQPAGGDGAGAA